MCRTCDIDIKQSEWGKNKKFYECTKYHAWYKMALKWTGQECYVWVDIIKWENKQNSVISPCLGADKDEQDGIKKMCRAQQQTWYSLDICLI